MPRVRIDSFFLIGNEPDYMMENMNHEPQGALFTRVRQMVVARGVDIRLHPAGNSLRLEFADGQRIVVNYDPHTQNVWVAARSGGTEFLHQDGSWLAHDRSELFARLDELLDQVIASDPVNARPPSAQVQQVTPPPAIIIRQEPSESHLLRNVSIVLLAGLFGFWMAQRALQPEAAGGGDAKARPPAVSQEHEAPGRACEAGFPANGNITTFPENGWRAGDETTEVVLKNDHSHPLLLMLTRPDTALPMLSVLVHARQEAVVNLPAGNYDLMFGTGSSWCSAKTGFSDGHILKFGQPLTVEMDRPVQLSMQSSGADAADFQLFVRTATPEVEIPEPTFSGDGTMEVRRHANGHFYLPGSIENVPVTFMVDTGASVTSISADIAREAGIRNCKEVQFQTAAGAATGCIALVQNMMLGNFELHNITVAVMPSMEINLLGANVLRNFQVSQGNAVMLIGRQ